MTTIDELRQEMDATGAALLEVARQREPRPITLEAQRPNGSWADLTPYVADWGPPFPDPMGMLKIVGCGPRTLQRQADYRARRISLAERLEITGGTGNFMVNLCRAGTQQAQADKRARRRGGSGNPAPKHPSRLLTAFGMRLRLDTRNDTGVRLVGGTPRQRAMYQRAVEKYTATERLA